MQGRREQDWTFNDARFNDARRKEEEQCKAWPRTPASLLSRLSRPAQICIAFLGPLPGGPALILSGQGAPSDLHRPRAQERPIRNQSEETTHMVSRVR